MKKSAKHGKLCQKGNDARKRAKKEESSTDIREDTPGLKVFYDIIWFERERVSFLSGESLDKYYNTDQRLNMFAHVLAKGKNKYPKFKLYKKNLILITPYEHFLLDHGNTDLRKKYAAKTGCNWDIIFDLREELKVEHKEKHGR